jgi:hypothetical protein
VKRNENYHTQVVEAINIYLPKSYGDYHSYQLMGPNGSNIAGIPQKNRYEYFIFALEQKIEPLCASEWNDQYLEQLCIVFENTLNLEDFIKKAFNSQPFAISPKAVELIDDLRSLSVEIVVAFKYNNKVIEKPDNLPLKQENLLKTIFMAKKYPRVEAAVDLFIVFLLQKLGYYDNSLFAFPQYPHTFQFGTTLCSAVPDFTIMDNLSFCRMVVVKDNSEAQLIAAAIAVYQNNQKIYDYSIEK